MTNNLTFEQLAQSFEIGAKILTSSLPDGVKEMLEKFVDTRFKSSSDPRGRKWVRRRIKYKHKKLLLTKRMFHAGKVSLAGRVGNREITYTNNTPYAYIHQYGESPVPRRPWLPDQDKIPLVIQKQIRKYVAFAFKSPLRRFLPIRPLR